MELPITILEQIVFNTGPKVEEHMLIVMDKSIHEEHLSEPLQTIKKQFKMTVTFLTDYNGIFELTDKNKKFCFKRSINDGNFNVFTINGGAYELENLNDEIKRNIIKEGYFTEENFPFIIDPIFFHFRLCFRY